MAAERALIAEFDHQHLTTVEERATFVRFLLEDANDILSKCRLFLWKTMYKPCDNPDMLEHNKF
jgi:hypothetical protein